MPSSASVSVSDRLRQLIVSGALRPGEPIRQEEHAQQLGTSRTPLREAILTLAAEGLVTLNPNRTATVFKPSSADLHEIYEIREILERAAIARVCSATEEPDFDELERLAEAMESSPKATTFSALNREFHDACYVPCGRSRLLALIGSYRRQADPYAAMFLAYGAHRDQAQHEHREIISALRAHDATRAKELISQHLQLTVNTLIAELDGH